MKGNRPYIQLIPSKVHDLIPDLCELLSFIPGFRRSYLQQIISIIAFNIRKNNDSAPLKMAYLRAVIPQAEQYVTSLIDMAIIERFGGYQPGKVSYRYRFTDEYQSKYKTVPCDDPKLIRRIEKLQSDMRRRNSKKYVNQNRWIRQMTIAPGWESAIDDNIHPDDIGRVNYATSAATRIMNRDIYISIDDTSHRVHSNLTNCPKILLPFIRIAEQQIVNLDIKNSQPFLSGMLLRDPAQFARFAKDDDLHMILKTLQVSQSKDVREYISLVKNGQIYESLMIDFADHGIDLNRDQVKESMLKILFDRNNHMNRHRRIFADNYPEVHRVFSIIRGDHTSRNKFRNYKRFAILLQTAESYLVNDCIVLRINDQHPGVITVTKYDSILTGILTDQADIVQAAIDRVFMDFFGVIPKIQIDKQGKEGDTGRENIDTNTMLEPLQVTDNQIYKVGRLIPYRAIKNEITEQIYLN